jgi:hypothetical protein
MVETIESQLSKVSFEETIPLNELVVLKDWLLEQAYLCHLRLQLLLLRLLSSLLNHHHRRHLDFNILYPFGALRFDFAQRAAFVVEVEPATQRFCSPKVLPNHDLVE